MNTQSIAMMERTPFLLPDVAASNDGFTKEELALVRAYANSFKEQIKLILAQRAENIESETGNGVEMERPPRVMPENEGHFEIGAEINGDRDELPL